MLEHPEGEKLSAALLRLPSCAHVQKEVQQEFAEMVKEEGGAKIMHLNFAIFQTEAAGPLLHHLSHTLADG